MISRCMLEHLETPEIVLREVVRVLKPGGQFIFLTPNKWDYISVIARLIPNFFHAKIVKFTEGRHEVDTFPTYYRANARRALARVCASCCLQIEELTYHNNYPANFMFSPTLLRMMIIYDRIICSMKCLNWLKGWLIGRLRKPVSL